MLGKTTFLILLWCFFGALKSAGDTVSTPKRLFGLGDVRHVAISPDQRFMATAGQGGAFLWDVQASTLLMRLDVPWSATALAFSPDSKSLAAASLGKIVAWNAETGMREQEFVGHGGEITRLRFSSGGEQLISASADNTVRVWLTETGSEIHSVRSPRSPIVDVAVSPDGKTLATVDTHLTNCVKIWDIQTESLLRTLPKTNWTAQRCIYTSDGDLITTSADRTVLRWNGDTMEQVRSFDGITGPTVIVADLWMPNDSTLAAACTDGSVYLWNLESASLLRVVLGEFVIAAIGVPNDHLVIAASVDHDVRIRQLPGGDTLRTFRGHTTSVHSGVAISPEGRFVLSGGTERLTRLWSRQSGQPVREFEGSPAGTMAAAFSPDGSRVLTTLGLPNPAARLWNTETGELVREFKWNGSWPMAAVFSPDGTRIATRSQSQSIRIFDVGTGNQTSTLANTAWGGSLAFSPQKPLLAAASTDFTVDLYNYETRQRLHTFFANAGPVTVVAFSPGGETLMIGWQDGVIHLYDSTTMELRRDFVVQAGFLESAAYSPNGQFILAGEGWPFFAATLWDAEKAELLRTFKGHKWGVGAVAFSVDGKNILTGAEVVREWSIADIAARLRMETLPNQTRLTWSAGVLQHASRVNGEWQTITNAVSPLTISATEPAGFYRVMFNETE